MGKSADRRRKAKKAKKKKAKLLKSLDTLKFRIPTPPPGFSFKSKKDYNRDDNRKAIDKSLKDED